MNKAIRYWVPCWALFATTAAAAGLRQVNYSESIQPQVRISAASSVAGLSLLPAGGVAKGERAFWVKLPKGFNGDLTVELTTHDHRFQATAEFQGDAPGGWQKLEMAPQTIPGKPSMFPEVDLVARTTALRAWIRGDAKESRKYVLIRWGAEPESTAFAVDRMRVQLNMGTATEAAAWLRVGKTLSAADCQPADKSSRSHVFFQWVCEFDGGLAPALAAPSDARLIVKRRERDGRETEDVLFPQW